VTLAYSPKECLVAIAADHFLDLSMLQGTLQNLDTESILIIERI
jgi:hypothetical protein